MTALLTWGYVLAAGSVLDPLYTALGWVMAWLYALVPSYGIAIILLTIAVRLVLYPLTVKQTKSMQAMQRLQPEIKRLQAKYKNDRQKLNEEMMKFYKENKVNPLSGCLPLILQLPLFIVLYRLIHDLTATVIAGAIVVGGVGVTLGTAGPGHNAVPAKPGYQHEKVSDGSVVKKDVQQPEGTTKAQRVLNDSVTADVLDGGTTAGQLKGKVIDGQVYDPAANAKDGHKKPALVYSQDGKTQIGTIDGAQAPAAQCSLKTGEPLAKCEPGQEDQAQGAKLDANPKHIPKKSQLAKDLKKTPGHMDWLGMDLAKRPSTGQGAELIGMYLLVALTVATGYYQQRQMTARTPQSAQNQQMQMMGKIFPLFFGFISLQVPAGVVLYFVVSNLWQIGQQAIIFRQQDAADAAAKAGGGKGGGGAKVPANPAPSAPVTPAAPAKTTPANPQSSAKSGPNPSNRSRRRRRRRKGR